MYTAGVRKVEEQWFEPPQSDLDRYLLRSRRRADNDNRDPASKISLATRFGACMALLSALALIGALAL